MMQTQRKNSSGPATEKAPTVALSADGRLEESNPGQPGAITLSSKKEFNNKGNFDRDMKVHYEPEDTLNRVIYSVCMAGEMAAHVATLEVSVKYNQAKQPTLTIHFPQPDSKTIPVGANGVMVEHPQCLYGANPTGVDIIYDQRTNHIIWPGQREPMKITLENFPKLRDKILESLTK